ncbi:MAG: hypothetical protein JWO68_567 [Actinomycetia bacterium]|nr:hypothetical protein [Actinomycetes bacterium]
MKLHELPLRLAAGAFVLHSGLEKWRAGEDTAAGVHGMAAGAYPFLKDLPPAKFLRLLAGGEIAVGGALLAPVVPAAVAGAALTGFAGGLLGLYARTPGLRRPGSIWPTQQGIAISKDVWLLGIGLGLVLDARANRSS